MRRLREALEAPVEGMVLPLSSRATTAWVVPIASSTCSWVMAASPRALMTAAAPANSSSGASSAATNFGSLRHAVTASSGPW